MTDVFVICPMNITGGPELCHQLVDALPGRAAMVYWPFDRAHETPVPYRHYNVPVVRRDDIPPGATVVLPETMGRLVGDFLEQRVLYWWMSVHNFWITAGWRAGEQLEMIRAHVAGHLYQSEYARRFLESSGLGPTRRLSDYLSAGYIRAITEPPSSPRQNILVFNPKKGMERTERVLKALAKGLREAPRVVPLEGMSAQQIQEILAVAKVYIDFGEHPGKDRFPREAAALGCCVLTNRRGSAANPIDVPIPAEFKVNDRQPGWERRAAHLIHKLLGDYDQQVKRFYDYRCEIAAEPAVFIMEVADVFSEVTV